MWEPPTGAYKAAAEAAPGRESEESAASTRISPASCDRFDMAAGFNRANILNKNWRAREDSNL